MLMQKHETTVSHTPAVEEFVIEGPRTSLLDDIDKIDDDDADSIDS